MKNSSKPKKLSFTVGITTCYGGESILDTVKSVRASRGVDENFPFILIADRNPIKASFKRELKKYNVELIENKTESGQIKKQKQILALCKSNVVIFTQDDILFEPDTLAKIMKHFGSHPKTTFVSVRKKPVEPTSLFEDITIVGTNVINRVAKQWNGGDNYLSAVGRCLGFRTEWIRGFNIPNNVVSTDAYKYFENKRRGGTYCYIWDAAILYKKPQNIKEHLRKSSRFQHQKEEMYRYFGDLKKEYRVPKILLIKATIAEFLTNPLRSVLFMIVYAYTRLFKINIKQSLNPIWQVDISTKKI